jgi:flagellar biogenesis protein FliO
MKLPFLNAFAPTQSEPPFVVTQAVVLLAFIALGVWAFVRFHPEREART